MHESDSFDGMYETPVGWLGIRLQGEKLSALDWIEPPRQAPGTRRMHPLPRQLLRCLDSYFIKATLPALPPLAPAGTHFQQRVRQALLKIPGGSVKTYGQLAHELKTGSRAIGQACRCNPIAVLVPCHRVVAASGLGGYMGAEGHLHIKRWLLRHEGVC